jgi:hypothetical protein
VFASRSMDQRVVEGKIEGGKVVLPTFSRSLVVRIEFGSNDRVGWSCSQ